VDGWGVVGQEGVGGVSGDGFCGGGSEGGEDHGYEVVVMRYGWGLMAVSC
jgi:hypothetical protein